MSMDAQFDNLKTLIDDGYARLANDPRVQNSALVRQNLDIADKFLLQARLDSNQGNQRDCRTHFHIARIRLNLAFAHMKPNSKKIKEKFSGRAQQCINELSDSIIEFKTVVEWKNCDVGSEVRQRFVEAVELLEDALIQFRFGDLQEAERIALGGLLLQYHLSCLLEDEYHEQLSITKRAKFTAEAASIQSLAKTLRQVRKAMINENIWEEQFILSWKHEYVKAEEALAAGITAYVNGNKKELEKRELEVHEHVVRLRNLLADQQKEENLSQRKENIVARKEYFDKQVNILRQTLKDRVENSQLFARRLVTIERLYGELYKSFESGFHFEADVLLQNAHAELKELRLHLRQLQLFQNENRQAQKQ